MSDKDFETFNELFDDVEIDDGLEEEAYDESDEEIQSFDDDEEFDEAESDEAESDSSDNVPEYLDDYPDFEDMDFMSDYDDEE